MTTKVRVSADEVMKICKLGVSTIRAERLVKLDSWLEAAMLERKPVFLFNIFGTKPKYQDRAAALEAMKVNHYGVSEYLWTTRYHLRDEERRLIRLSNMAQSSIDNTIFLDGEDHALVRKYAAGYLWFAGEQGKEVA